MLELFFPDRRSGFHSDTRDPKYGIMSLKKVPSCRHILLFFGQKKAKSCIASIFESTGSYGVIFHSHARLHVLFSVITLYLDYFDLFCSISSGFPSGLPDVSDL